MTDLAPVQEQSRIKSLDVVRGFALLGILAVNAAFFAAPWQAAQNPLLWRRSRSTRPRCGRGS